MIHGLHKNYPMVLLCCGIRMGTCKHRVFLDISDLELGVSIVALMKKMLLVMYKINFSIRVDLGPVCEKNIQ